jgi:hypothetical protein
MGIASIPHPPLKLGAGGIFLPVRLAKRLYAPTVTSDWPIQNPLLSVTGWAGFSSSPHALSPGEQPIWKVPGGIQMYLSPSFGFCFTSPAANVWGFFFGGVFFGGGVTSGCNCACAADTPTKTRKPASKM